MDGLFPTIFHGERSELREKFGLAHNLVVHIDRLNRQPFG